ncbi:MAG: glycosyltransferase family 4 protein [Nanoarchaeota archaeon]
MKIAVTCQITRTFLSWSQVPEIFSNKDVMMVKFSEQLKKRGFDVDLYIPDLYKPKINEDYGIKVTYVSTLLKSIFPPTQIPFTPGVFFYLRNNYDIIICSEIFQWNTVFAVLAKIFSFKRKIKVIIWQELAAHQRFLWRMPSIFYHRVILRFFLDQHIDLYIPCGTRARKFLISLEISAKKISRVISHGVDQEIFFYDPTIIRDNYIFSPSRLVHIKRIDVLLKAFSIVIKEAKDIKLIIQGEGPLLGEYQNLVQRLDIADNVIFNTKRSPHSVMGNIYRKALCTVLCSQSDLMVFSVKESINCGTPVILSRGIDFSEEFQDCKGGISFNNGDYCELAKQLLIMIQSSSFRENMCKEALEKSKMYSNNFVIEEFQKILNKFDRL